MIACIEGHNRAHGLDEPEVMTGDDFDDMAARHLEAMKVMGHA
jgi:hypothetical protein